MFRYEESDLEDEEGEEESDEEEDDEDGEAEGGEDAEAGKWPLSCWFPKLTLLSSRCRSKETQSRRRCRRACHKEDQG